MSIRTCPVTREEYVEQVKHIAQTIIERADDIVGDISTVSEIKVEFSIERGTAPGYTVTKNVCAPLGLGEMQK